jgi:hypothetical protein
LNSDSLKKDLLSSDLAAFWPSNLKPAFRLNDMHGAKTDKYENAMGKLYELGLSKGMRPLVMEPRSGHGFMVVRM